jgi:polar amino acid transport system permease protein
MPITPTTRVEASRATSRRNDDDLQIVATKHPLRWIGTAITALLLAMLGYSFATNHAFEWPIVGQYLFNDQVLHGVVLTLELTGICMGLAIILGTVLAVLRLSRSFLLVWISWGYTWFFRSVPQLVQLIFWFNLGALYPKFSIGIPFGPTFVSVPTNSVISAMTAAIFGLGLAQAAYTAEIVRAGILAVDRGQREAAEALGLSELQILSRVVLPQAMRMIIPPLGNELIGMLKNTSLVSVIALADLFYSVQLIYARNYETIPLLITASLWYLAIVSILSFGQRLLERHYGRGVRVRGI